jgi:hypothetical protein
MKADDMAAKSYFAHTSPEGIDPWYWFNQAGYKFTYAGENLAVDFSDSSAVNTAWMNSPTHRANLLDQHYTEIGIATADGMYQGHMTTFVVEEFGTPLPAKEEVSPAPQQVTNVPKNPTVPATASAAPTSRVLGESTAPKEPEPAQTVTTENVQSGPSMTVTYASPVAHAVASPNQTLKYIYYGFAAIILILLAFATGFEIHVRHIKKAAGAGFLLALMIFLFAAGSQIVFTAPTVPADASMAASATAFR